MELTCPSAGSSSRYDIIFYQHKTKHTYYTVTKVMV